MVSPRPSSRVVLYALTLIIGGAAGVIAAFALVLDSLAVAADPNAALTCSVNATVNCATNIASWQGHVFFGVSNPVWGLGLFVAPIVVGMMLLSGARFRAWFWALFGIGMTFAAVFVLWLAYQSVFALRTLCPWCALVYVAVIPMWIATLVAAPASGAFGTLARDRGRALTWAVPILSLVVLVLIFGVAQVRLDVLGTLLR
ncbi:vitamin K epoxide reductase family protein [Microbacterium gorillae]|uniref:vitamin K epoxide reductase family protein n=1 Tax=Microbacterium gorillae TaxID=1231063 RepID=UPI00058CA717|nr:vitamin K epoxide reductase family protein [Microbacterium gorillae]